MKMPTKLAFSYLLAEKISCSVEHEKSFITSGSGSALLAQACLSDYSVKNTVHPFPVGNFFVFVKTTNNKYDCIKVIYAFFISI